MFNHADTLRFALRDDKIVHVDDVETGLDCGCLCPAEGCREPLVAKNRRFADRIHVTHFAHQTKKDCPGARESALHRIAKEIVQAERKIWAPGIPLFPAGAPPWQVFRPAGVIGLTEVRQEQPLDGFTPDLIARSEFGIILIEICVTHAVDQPKLDATHRLGWTMLEVLLGDLLHTDYTRDAVYARLIAPRTQAKWIRHEAVIARRVEIFSLATEIQAGPDDCPLGLGLAKSFEVLDGVPVWSLHKNDAPCDRCPCRLDMTTVNEPHGQSFLHCLGRDGIDSQENLARFQAGQPMTKAPWLARFRRERAIRDQELQLTHDRGLLELASERLRSAYQHGIDAIRAKADAEWVIPFCEIGPGETKVELAPNPLTRRLRALPHKRPLRAECADRLDQRQASNLGLYWDPRLNTWIFLSHGFFQGTDPKTPRPTVPINVRELIDPNSDWVPVFPDEAHQIRAVR